jgi:hypothetical protein
VDRLSLLVLILQRFNGPHRGSNNNLRQKKKQVIVVDIIGVLGLERLRPPLFEYWYFAPESVKGKSIGAKARTHGCEGGEG